MALYPLPPSSNESVIDNGSNVWQMAMPIILVLSHNLSKQCLLSHAGTLPWRFSVHCKMNMETILHSRRTIQFLLIFLSFSARSKTDGRCRSAVLNWRLSGASVCHCLFSAFNYNVAFKGQSISAMDWLQPHACTSILFCSDLFEITQWLATL